MDENQTRSRVAELNRGSGRCPGENVLAWGSVELEAELTEWLKCLPARHLATVAFYIDLLAGQGPRLGWPHTRQLDTKLRKLRFHLDGRAVRIFYWIAPGHRIVLLTVFMKARMRERSEISRARIALKRAQIEELPSRMSERRAGEEERDG